MTLTKREGLMRGSLTGRSPFDELPVTHAQAQDGVGTGVARDKMDRRFSVYLRRGELGPSLYPALEDARVRRGGPGGTPSSDRQPRCRTDRAWFGPLLRVGLQVGVEVTRRGPPLPTTERHRRRRSRGRESAAYARSSPGNGGADLATSARRTSAPVVATRDDRAAGSEPRLRSTSR